jgi:hypothetical protein
MAGVLSATTAATQPDLSKLPDWASDPSKADFGSMTGALKQATTYTPSNDALVSGQLSKLLNQDSDYMQAARTKALQSMNARGLANSSMAVGASQAAAIEAGRPIAEGDASAYLKSESDNAAARNQYGMQSNDFANQGAQAKFKGVLEAAAQQRDLAQKNDDLNFRRDSTQQDLDIRRAQLDADTAYRNSDLAFRQDSANKDLALRNRATDADIALKQSDLAERARTATQQSRTQLASDISKVRQMALDAQMRLEADPNMSGEAKKNAIAAISLKAAADIAEMVRFSGLEMPQAWPDWINRDTSSAGESGPNSGTSSGGNSTYQPPSSPYVPGGWEGF